VLDALVYLRDDIIPALGLAFDTYVQPIINFVAENVKLQDVMLALGIAIAAFVLPILASLVIGIASILAPVFLVIGAIALLRTAWEQNWGGIQEKTAAVIDFIVPLVQGALASISAWWAENGDSVIKTVTDFGKNVIKGFTVYFKTIETIVKTVLDAIKTFWDRHGADVMAIWETFRTNIQNGFTAFGLAITAIIQLALDKIKEFWDAHGAAVMEVVQFMWDTISGAFELATENINLIVAAFLDVIQGDFEGARDNVIALVQGWWETILSIFTTAAENIQNAFNDVDWGALGTALMGGIASGITASGPALLAAAMAVINSVIAAVQGAWAAFVGAPLPPPGAPAPPPPGTQPPPQTPQDAMPEAKSGLAMAAYSPVSTASQIINNINNQKNTTVHFTGNYSSSPQVTDGSSLAAIMAGYA
jgi:phage-related protein